MKAKHVHQGDLFSPDGTTAQPLRGKVREQLIEVIAELLTGVCRQHKAQGETIKGDEDE